MPAAGSLLSFKINSFATPLAPLGINPAYIDGVPATFHILPPSAMTRRPACDVVRAEVRRFARGETQTEQRRDTRKRGAHHCLST